jgi:hypothetical protein
MKRNLYLAWDGRAWGVYGEGTMPDPHGTFPDYFYRKYIVPEDKEGEVFEKLKNIKEELIDKNIIPSKENQSEVFPELEDLLE